MKSTELSSIRRPSCQIECAVIAQVYDVEADGHCDLHQTCQCHISDTISFKDAWKKKFHTGYVFRKIAHSEMLLEQAHRVFNYPLRTADQFKQLLKPVLSPYQFSKLETDDESLAAKFTNKDNSVDIPAVEKYVSEEVAKLLKSSDDSLLKEKYKDKFTEALENSKDSEGTLHNLIFRVRQLKNEPLEEAVKAYLKKNNLTEPVVELTEKEGLTEILTNAITNEIIKQNDEKNKPAKKVAAKKPVAKKPAAKKAAPAAKRGPRFQSPKKSS
ncbi:hypothetical protein U1Q18_049272 [Sarracenia purpurea var. burkii]